MPIRLSFAHLVKWNLHQVQSTEHLQVCAKDFGAGMADVGRVNPVIGTLLDMMGFFRLVLSCVWLCLNCFVVVVFCLFVLSFRVCLKELSCLLFVCIVWLG